MMSTLKVGNNLRWDSASHSRGTDNMNTLVTCSCWSLSTHCYNLPYHHVALCLRSFYIFKLKFSHYRLRVFLRVSNFIHPQTDWKVVTYAKKHRKSLFQSAVMNIANQKCHVWAKTYLFQNINRHVYKNSSKIIWKRNEDIRLHKSVERNQDACHVDS